MHRYISMQNLDWKKVDRVLFNDNPKKRIWTAKVHKYFEPKELQDQYQKISDELHAQSKHSLSIACAVHYEKINRWTAGQFGDPVVVLDVSYNKAFEHCDIDGMELLLIVDNDEDPNPSMIHPKKTHLEHEPSMFAKYKK